MQTLPLDPNLIQTLQSAVKKLTAGLSSMFKQMCKILGSKYPRIALSLPRPDRIAFMQFACVKKGHGRRQVRRMTYRQLKKTYLLS